jgi:hypothetical protein
MFMAFFDGVAMVKLQKVKLIGEPVNANHLNCSYCIIESISNEERVSKYHQTDELFPSNHSHWHTCQFRLLPPESLTRLI